MKQLNPHRGLLQVLLSDLARYRGLVFWCIVLVISALATVYITHLNRELMAERESLLQQRDALDVEWRHLVLEQTALAEHSRIERLASRELGLQRPRDEQEVLVPWR